MVSGPVSSTTRAVAAVVDPTSHARDLSLLPATGDESGIDRGHVRVPADQGLCGPDRPPDAGVQRLLHYPGCFMLAPEQVADLMLHHGQQVHSVLLALVSAAGELGIAVWSTVHEPTPAGRVVVQPDDPVGGPPERPSAQVGDADVDLA